MRRRYTHIYIVFFITCVILFTGLQTNSIKGMDEHSAMYISKNPFPKVNVTPRLVLTYKTLDVVPNRVMERFKKNSNGFNLHFFDDIQCTQFLNQHYGVNVLSKYTSLNSKAHKADLFRYCYLYKFGGIYLDIKCVLYKQLKDIFEPDVITTCLSISPNTIFQAIIAIPPHHPVMKRCIHKILHTDNSEYNKNYLLITRQMYSILNESYEMKYGKNTSNNGGMPLELLKEVKTSNCMTGKKDRYNLCIEVHSKRNGPVLYARDPEYPY